MSKIQGKYSESDESDESDESEELEEFDIELEAHRLTQSVF